MGFRKFCPQPPKSDYLWKGFSEKLLIVTFQPFCTPNWHKCVANLKFPPHTIEWSYLWRKNVCRMWQNYILMGLRLLEMLPFKFVEISKFRCGEISKSCKSCWKGYFWKSSKTTSKYLSKLQILVTIFRKYRLEKNLILEENHMPRNLDFRNLRFFPKN